MIHHASKHAKVRAQQRGFTAQIDVLLDRYGRHQHDHHGAEIVYFDHRARMNAWRQLGTKTLAQLESKLFNSYKVVSVDTGDTITIGHRLRRIRRS